MFSGDKRKERAMGVTLKVHANTSSVLEYVYNLHLHLNTWN